MIGTVGQAAARGGVCGRRVGKRWGAEYQGGRGAEGSAQDPDSGGQAAGGGGADCGAGGGLAGAKAGYCKHLGRTVPQQDEFGSW